MAKVEPAEEGMNRYEPSRRCSRDVFLTTVYAGPHEAKWAKYVYVQCCDEVFDCAEGMDEVIWCMGRDWGSDIERSRVGEAELWSCSDIYFRRRLQTSKVLGTGEGVWDACMQASEFKIMGCVPHGPIVQGHVISNPQ